MRRGFEPNRHGKIKRVVAQIVNKVKDEGKVSIAKLALELGYNPHYLKYSIIPAVLEITRCIEKDGKYLVWICTDEEKTEPTRVKEPKYDDVGRVLAARPVAEDSQRSEVVWGGK